MALSLDELRSALATIQSLVTELRAVDAAATQLEAEWTAYNTDMEAQGEKGVSDDEWDTLTEKWDEYDNAHNDLKESADQLKSDIGDVVDENGLSREYVPDDFQSHACRDDGWIRP